MNPIKQAIEALEQMAVFDGMRTIASNAISALRTLEGQAPFGWMVEGSSQQWYGEYARADAEVAARRIGGTCVAFPIYRGTPQPEPAPAEKVAQVQVSDWRDSEIEGLQNTVIKQGNMLSEIVNLIRGEPEDGAAHSTHDAVELVRGLKMHCDQYARAAQYEIGSLKEHLSAAPLPPAQSEPVNRRLLEALRNLMTLADTLARNCADRVDISCDPSISDARAIIAEAEAQPVGRGWLSRTDMARLFRSATGDTRMDPSDERFGRAVERAHGITGEGE